MDFARKQLEKYGWKEGQGLGKKEDGIVKPIKPKLKFDNSGIGHDAAEQFTNNWWEQIYNKASSNISVNNDSEAVKVKLKSGKSVNITTSKYDVPKKSVQNGFVKTATLTAAGVVNAKMDDEECNAVNEVPVTVMTDEELFAACGKRTAHKGARHGLRQSGKLSRIEKQERMLLKKLKNVSLSDDEYILQKKVRKLSKHKEKCGNALDCDASVVPDELDSLSSCSSNVSQRKKKKNKRRVSFNETVTEYHSQDLDSTTYSFDSDASSEKCPIIVESQIRDDNPNAVQEDGADEGIEQDLEDVETGETLGHASFEEPHVSTLATALDKLSKEERNLLKKKRKLDRKGRATMRFLEEMDPDIDLDSVIDNQGKKRKLKSEVIKYDEVIPKKAHSELDFSHSRRPSKKKRRKLKKQQREETQINSIVQSLNNACKISDTE